MLWIVIPIKTSIQTKIWPNIPFIIISPNPTVEKVINEKYQNFIYSFKKSNIEIDDMILKSSFMTSPNTVVTPIIIYKNANILITHIIEKKNLLKFFPYPINFLAIKSNILDIKYSG